MQAIAKEQGHEEMVANPRQVRLISQNRKKSNRKDGELLGRLGRVDPELLYPIQHRGEAAQADLDSGFSPPITRQEMEVHPEALGKKKGKAYFENSHR
ncbi:hypothetical protein MYX82_02340 [Acidobacteria bacterium AH-259-D05]|nr:hypothetical protein [Acidobacteria bacterium AH-259-D05]